MRYGSSPKWLASGIKTWKLKFGMRICCALTSAFNKIANKNIVDKCLFLQANALFAGNAFCKKNSSQTVSFKLHISRRQWPKVKQPCLV
jgi:hypothetical protein